MKVQKMIIDAADGHYMQINQGVRQGVAFANSI